MQGFREYEKSKKHDTSRVHNNLPGMDPRNREIYDLPNKEFKIVYLRKLN